MDEELLEFTIEELERMIRICHMRIQDEEHMIKVYEDQLYSLLDRKYWRKKNGTTK